MWQNNSVQEQFSDASGLPPCTHEHEADLLEFHIILTSGLAWHVYL